MPTILKREFAPVSENAWAEIDSEAADAIRNVITSRRVVDFNGPYGWELGAVNTGRLELESKGKDQLCWGIRKTQSLIEVREPFVLKQMEIDNLTRGSSDVDLDPVQEVASKAAVFEDKVIYQGFKEAGITGIIDASEHDKIKLPESASKYPAAAAKAVKALTSAGITGPFNLVLSADQYYELMGAAGGGYPPHRTVSDLLDGGEIILSKAVEGGILLSGRGGDFELTVGKDFAVGYASHNKTDVEFFITESFTFRVLEPKAAVVLG
ncbi:family 1 encapsulin nanocompartment shell protein [Sedimentisphaera salicampi]|uniref:Maritimacin n=1 Tax=Sedimentisphaera salicampi TaxID=1941349 RepID=A0A1W6LPG0_9BACT|nr:family 1 encapsulin nanocompartment shell protein [Sedimentisphaera salicampi]ARN57641.1 Maritimacin [Sedimentisphaera salicampi]OXU14209.1 Maritimacin [Sedimentisphaera salicampi]